MTGLSGAHGDFRSFHIANFTDENDIRIVPQDRAEAAGKSQSDIVAHLHLGDSFELVFDRVLDSDDFAGLIVRA